MSYEKQPEILRNSQYQGKNIWNLIEYQFNRNIRILVCIILQAEVWKADFDAERSAREAQHHDKEKMQEEMKQLQIRNQQLLDEVESSSRKQFSEMQQRHVPNTYQQTLQQRLGVVPPGGYPQYNQPGAHNQGYPHANPPQPMQGQGYQPHYPPAQNYPNPYQQYPEQNRTQAHGADNVGAPQQHFRQVSLCALISEWSFRISWNHLGFRKSV